RPARPAGRGAPEPRIPAGTRRRLPPGGGGPREGPTGDGGGLRVSLPHVGDESGERPRLQARPPARGARPGRRRGSAGARDRGVGALRAPVRGGGVMAGRHLLYTGTTGPGRPGYAKAVYDDMKMPRPEGPAQLVSMHF